MQFRKNLPESGGSKNFVKLKDKESVSGIFMGEIHEFFVVWEGGKTRVVPEGDPDGKFRFRVNFIVKDGSSYVPKVFEQGLTVYRQLAELNEEYGLEQIVVRVTRNGTGTDTSYSLLPLLKQEISKETAQYLKTLDLLPLETKPAPANSDDGEIPF